MDQPLTSGEKSNTAVEHLAHRLKVDFVELSHEHCGCMLEPLTGMCSFCSMRLIIILNDFELMHVRCRQYFATFIKLS